MLLLHYVGEYRVKTAGTDSYHCVTEGLDVTSKSAYMRHFADRRNVYMNEIVNHVASYDHSVCVSAYRSRVSGGIEIGFVKFL